MSLVWILVYYSRYCNDLAPLVELASDLAFSLKNRKHSYLYSSPWESEISHSDFHYYLVEETQLPYIQIWGKRKREIWLRAGCTIVRAYTQHVTAAMSRNAHKMQPSFGFTAAILRARCAQTNMCESLWPVVMAAVVPTFCSDRCRMFLLFGPCLCCTWELALKASHVENVAYLFWNNYTAVHWHRSHLSSVCPASVFLLFLVARISLLLSVLLRWVNYILLCSLLHFVE
jgi:hypothetical protein